MRIISFNANGIRSAASKGFMDWFKAQDADILCLQETKAQAEQLQHELYYPNDYHVHFRDAVKKGYSGVGIYSKREPDRVLTEIGWDEFDNEGRYIEAQFGNLSVVSFYIPSGSSKEERQDFKYVVMDRLQPILDGWRASGRDYVLTGDWNIVRCALDITNWKSNQKTSGVLPREREWMNRLMGHDVDHNPLDGFLDGCWVDAYRHLHPQGQDYTWWSNRGAAFAKNVGWRIDYQLCTPSLRDKIVSCSVAREPRFSDHAPFTVDYDYEHSSSC